MDTKKIDIVQFDYELFNGKILFQTFTDEFKAKVFSQSDTIVVDPDRKYTNDCKAVIRSKGVNHIREIYEDGGEYYIKPEEGEFFIHLLIIESIRKSCVAGVVGGVVRLQ